MTVILIDLDDTLIPDVEARDQTLSEALTGTSEQITLHDALDVVRERWQASGLRDLPPLAGVSSWEALWTDFDCFGALPRNARLRGSEFHRRTWRDLLPSEDPTVAAMSFREHREAAVIPYQWVDGALDALSARHTLWCATNGSSPLQRRKLELAGLAGRFARTFVSGEIGAEKDSELFARTVREALVASGESAASVVGDSQRSDGALAEALGVTFTLVTPGSVWSLA
ncbi:MULTISPECIES: HAD family hydrolase [unclassified Curtobacterium]|uniref:HAD family hydrolase n=1 Tax=unclassified Curtobacterium TaxID=257496 RepID=UPI00226B2731|nr:MULTISPECIES: HAD family hydrolase [unclassified Curtobacterium]